MIEVESQLVIRKDGKCFLDAKKTELLKEIARNGSLSSAAKKLHISYQHAWTMIQEMNHAAPHFLVEKQRGGLNGGGAVITSYGERILNEYGIIEAQIKKLIREINNEINF
jgi:molybdate transport system regulatory protein